MIDSTLVIDVEIRRPIASGESLDDLVAEAVTEAARRADVLAQAAGGTRGPLVSWHWKRMAQEIRRPYPLSDIPLRVDGFPDSSSWSTLGAARDAVLVEGAVVLSGIWKWEGPPKGA